jgi:hypothetical protein
LLLLDEHKDVGALLLMMAGTYYLAIIIPSLGCAVRRLHDTGRSGWWLLINFIPMVSIVLLVFFLMDSESGTNQYGPNPKSIGSPTEVTPIVMESQTATVVAANGPGLTQWERVAYIFSAPSKTFEDIKRGNKSWWMPFLVVALVGYLFFAAVAYKIGLQQVVANQIHLNPKSEERMAMVPEAQRQKANEISVYITEGVFVVSPALTMDIIGLLSLGLWGTINLAFGGKGNYGQILAVWFYASLPSAIKTVLGVVVIYAGMAPESFNIKNFAPTNIGAFLNPLETNKALYTLASSLDAVTIWTLVLLGMGTAIVAGVKRTSGYIAVFGWWAIFVLIGVGIAAVTG